MANEQLQFRLQSHPNLSSNQDSILNSSSYASFSDENKDSSDTTKSQYQYQQKQQQQQQQPRHARAYTMHPSSVTSSEDSEEISVVSPQPPPVKLRSKSFKNQNTSIKTSENNSSMNKSLYNTLSYQKNQFRPVSDTFNFNLNDQNINMTKSFNVMYDKHNNSSSSNDNYFDNLASDLERNEDNCNKLTNDDCDEGNDESEGSSSSLKSSSILDANFDCIKDEDQMTKSVPCMDLKSADNHSTDRQTEFSDEEIYLKPSDLENGSSLC